MTGMDLVLLFFAVTCLYTGFLTLSQSVAVASLCGLAGLLLGLRPGLRLFRTIQFEWKLHGWRQAGKRGGKKGHLHIVKPKEKKEKPPTYH